VVVIVPQATPVHPAPESVQVTALLVVPVTVAVNCCCAPVITDAVVGEMVTLTADADWMTTVADADLVGSATDVAVTITIADRGTVAGAV
jgi:hypothetical protein